MPSPTRQSPLQPARSGSRRARPVQHSLQFAIFPHKTATPAYWFAAPSISRERCSPKTDEKARFSMIYSSDRILTAHAGSLPRPDDLREMVVANARSEGYDRAALEARLKSAVADIVKRQVECGLDV